MRLTRLQRTPCANGTAPASDTAARILATTRAKQAAALLTLRAKVNVVSRGQQALRALFLAT